MEALRRKFNIKHRTSRNAGRHRTPAPAAGRLPPHHERDREGNQVSRHTHHHRELAAHSTDVRQRVIASAPAYAIRVLDNELTIDSNGSEEQLSS